MFIMFPTDSVAAVRRGNSPWRMLLMSELLWDRLLAQDRACRTADAIDRVCVRVTGDGFGECGPGRSAMRYEVCRALHSMCWLGTW